MTIEPQSGRLAFPEIGLVVHPGLTRTEFLRLPTGAVVLARVRHDPSFRYQLPALPEADTVLYVVLRFHYERLEAVDLFHHAERFEGGTEAAERARQGFHLQWLRRSGADCGRYRWGTVASNSDPVGRSSSIVIEYARPNAWQIVGRKAGQVWGAASSR